ncbi:MAG TPA: tol-pal system-associated acyl-CoA thioesterase [Burkholderiales bacterium]
MPQPFVFTIRIYYEDTDAGGIVYYANYLKYLERARTEWLRALGVEQDELARREGVIFVVRSAAIEFLKPAYFNDLIEVSADIARLRGASMTFAQTIRRAASAAGNESEILCEAEVRVASIDAATRAPRPLPAALRRRLEEATT